MIVGAAFAAVSAEPAWADRRTEGYYGHHMWGDGWHMVFGPLMMVLFVAIIVVGVVLLVRWVGGAGRAAPPPAQSALDILKERFARGEIDAQEFAERRRLLEE
jgi:putative membrane protein